MSPLTIRWQSAPLPTESTAMGHGFCVCAGSLKDRSERLVAFVEGFKWRRDATEAVVLFDPRRVPSDEQQFTAFKTAVEARIRRGDISHSEVLAGYWGIANAVIRLLHGGARTIHPRQSFQQGRLPNSTRFFFHLDRAFKAEL